MGRKRKLYTYKGQTLSRQEWAKKLNLTYTGFTSRVERYYPEKPEKIFFAFRKGQAIAYGGETLTRSQWAKKLNITLPALRRRINKHYPENLDRVFCQKNKWVGGQVKTVTSDTSK